MAASLAQPLAAGAAVDRHLKAARHHAMSRDGHPSPASRQFQQPRSTPYSVLTIALAGNFGDLDLRYQFSPAPTRARLTVVNCTLCCGHGLHLINGWCEFLGLRPIGCSVDYVVLRASLAARVFLLRVQRGRAARKLMGELFG